MFYEEWKIASAFILIYMWHDDNIVLKKLFKIQNYFNYIS